MISARTFLRKAAVILLFIAGFFLLYWIKCQNNINIFKSFKLEDYLPVQFLQRQTPIIDSSNSHPIHEDFENHSLSHWAKFWSRSGKGRAGIVREGAEGSNCLKIWNESAKNWSLSYEALVEVAPGERFRCDYAMKTQGNIRANIGVVLCDSKHRIQNWHLAGTPVATGEWALFWYFFIVPEQGKYFQIRFCGEGEGIAWVDNITISKQKGGNQNVKN